MKQIVLRIAFLAIFFVQAMATAFAAEALPNLPKGSHAVLGIHSVQPLDTLKATLGEPDEIYVGPNIGIPGLFPAPFAPFGDPIIYTYKGANFIAAKYYNRSTYKFSGNHYVYGVDIFDKGTTTARGLGIGDSDLKVIRLYGKPHKEQAAPKSSALTGKATFQFDTIFFYKVDAEGGVARMTVYLEKNKVTGITMAF